MSVKPDAVLQPGPDTVFRELEGEAVILHLGTATYFGLDEVGTRVWQLLAEGRSVRDVCAALSDEFDAPPERIREDVSALVDELLQKDLVRAIG
jgi:hypothetical protein